jgi:hypothetical protein
MESIINAMTWIKEKLMFFCYAMIALGGCLVILLLLPMAAYAASGPGSIAFKQGSTRLAIHGGGSTAFNQTYSVFGIGGSYFVADGIEVGLDAEAWSGASPGITQVSPQVRYVLNAAGPFNPYAGVFYQRAFIRNNPDNDTVGGRVGVFYAAGQNTTFGAGVVHANHLNCDRAMYSSCSETRPELSFAVIF